MDSPWVEKCLGCFGEDLFFLLQSKIAVDRYGSKCLMFLAVFGRFASKAFRKKHLRNKKLNLVKLMYKSSQIVSAGTKSIKV